MASFSQTIAANGETPVLGNWFVIDSKQPSCEVGFGCTVTGTVTYAVEHTYDNVLDSSVTPVAFTHATVTGKTAAFEGTYTTPIKAMRVKTTAGTGTVTIKAVQFGV